jgi:RNA polymerase sigma-70 factor (ECF subfamily)
MEFPLGSPMRTDPESLLSLAKAGCGLALSRLLDRNRDTLAVLAPVQIGRRLQVKLDVDDLLQEVSLEALRDIGQLRGSSEGEFLSWLRTILGAIVSNQVRRYFGTQRRDVRRDRPIEAKVGSSSGTWDRSLVAPDTSPTQRAARHERAARLAEAMETLPEVYHQVIVLRHFEGLGFAEVAHRMGRTEDSVKNIWVRALHRLRGLLGDLR